MAIYNSLTLPNNGNSIRLFKLDPSTHSNAPITGTLNVALISDSPQYEALSYCWGDPTATEYIHTNEANIPIAANLAAAQRALRRDNSIRTIWIDAMCINQQDIDEKNFQVPLMRSIYANCNQTVVWLGDSDKSSRQAFAAIKKNDQSYPRALTSVLHRPWFTRIWVLQEVAFAPLVVVQCGQDIIEWDLLLETTSTISTMGSMVTKSADGIKIAHPSLYVRIMGSTRSKIKSGSRFSIREAMRRFQPFSATNPLDKIYGVMGMLRDQQSVVVDYDKSVAEVYQDTALAIMNHSRSLDILLDCTQSVKGPSIPGLPSWVPDWSSVDHHIDIVNVSATERYSASQGTQINTANLLNDECLELCGHIIGSIAQLGREIPSVPQLRKHFWPEGRLLPAKRAFNIGFLITGIFGNWKEVTRGPEHGSAHQSNLYPTGESRLVAFYNTIHKMNPAELDTEKAQKFDKMMYTYEYLIAGYEWYLNILVARLPWWVIWIISGPWAAICGFILIPKLLRGQMLIEEPNDIPDASRQSWVPGRMNNGLMGLFPAPDITDPEALPSIVGDSIVVLKGGARPYVLRREGEERWRLIGDAFVYGIMHGAAFDEDKCVDICIV